MITKTIEKEATLSEEGTVIAVALHEEWPHSISFKVYVSYQYESGFWSDRILVKIMSGIKKKGIYNSGLLSTNAGRIENVRVRLVCEHDADINLSLINI